MFIGTTALQIISFKIQRVIRFYDPDFHMIEIGESMDVIAKRYLSQGFSAEKVSDIIQHPIEFVQSCI